jgi:phosphoglycerol transferase MdoB-like AlkP superfamily enzyme
VRYCRDLVSMSQPAPTRIPWWLRAYLLVGAVQGLTIALTGLLRPAHVIGFPLVTTPLNTRFVASFYLAGATGLIASAAAHRAVDTRIYVVGFTVVTTLLLVATVWYWSTYTAVKIPYPWLISYVLEPIAGVAILRRLRLGRPARPGRHRLTPLFTAQAAVFGLLGIVLAVAPATAVRLWPWALTVVLARTYSAIFIAFAVGAALAAGEARPAAVRPFALSSLVLVAATAGVSLFHHDRFDGGPATWVWAAGLAAGLAAFGVAGAASFRAGARPT